MRVSVFQLLYATQKAPYELGKIHQKWIYRKGPK